MEQYLYYRGQLSRTEQRVYDLLKSAMASRCTSAVTPRTDEQSIERILFALRCDDPMLYAVDFGGLQSLVMPDRDSFTFGCRVTLPQKRATDRALRKALREYLQSVNTVPPLSTEEKLRRLHDRLLESTRCAENDRFPDASHTAVGALVDGTCVSDGYAAAFKLLMDALEIPCITVEGRAGDTGLHAWNIVQIDGRHLHVDVTFDGAPGEYACFLRTDAEIAATHTVAQCLPVPACP